jgi:biopolymer transport protein ExbB/TolQ
VATVALGLVGYTVIGIVLALISIATAATLRAVMPGS